MSIDKIIIGLFSAMLIMISVDKFFPFLTPCNLLADVNPMVWKGIGIIQLTAGILVWNAKFRKSIAFMILGLMIYFTIRHLVVGTTDVGGAVFMALVAILIIWNPWPKKVGIQNENN